jgi:uncharacterized protein
MERDGHGVRLAPARIDRHRRLDADRRRGDGSPPFDGSRPLPELLVGPGLPLSTALVVAALAFAAAIVGGVAGYGTGLLLPLVLVPTIGAEATVPVLGLAAIFTNGGRIAAFRRDIAWNKVRRLALPALPAVAAGAWFNAWLSGRAVTILIGLTLLAMLPARRWLERNGLTVPDRLIPLIGVAFGFLMGGTTGAGVILIGLLSGLGLAGAALIATDAMISLLAGAAKSLAFGTLGALTPELALLGVAIGCATFPAGFAARALLRAIPLKVHAAILDAVIVIGGLSLLWRGLAGASA